MRLGIVTSSYAISKNDTVNAGVFVRDLANELASQGHEVHVITPHKKGIVNKSSSVKEFYFPWLGGAKDLASASLRNPVTLIQYASLIGSGLVSVTNYVHQNKLEVLLAMWAIPSGIFCGYIKQRFGIPYGVWALGSDIWARKKYPFGEWTVKKILKNASFRFADGVRLSEDVKMISDASCHFVPSSRQLNSDLLDPDFFLKKDLPNLLFIGRYEKNKGPDILVDSACILLEKGYKFYLHMFGVGSLRNDLAKKLRGYEEYIYLNDYASPKTTVNYMKNADWLVIPSRIESIPLIFSDALQMSLPIVTTNVGDIGRLTKQLDVGFVAPTAEKDQLANAIIKAISSDRQEFSLRCVKAAEIFSLHKSAEQCLVEFQKAVSEK